ncbi:MAG: RNA chaperone Hfq [Clostridia bacterium]|nr:RNA chaperone Hfq [Clostridia bacterium]MBQ5820076.1 RNA chaperone Hfq [Clostridia bacterium]
MEQEVLEAQKSVRNGNIQDQFLNNARKNRLPIIVYLVSGFQLRGVVKSFDNYVILLESDGKESMIYKHAVSTISPI